MGSLGYLSVPLQFLMYSSKGKGLELYIRTTKKDNQGQAKAGSLICHIYDLEVKNIAYVTISEANQYKWKSCS